MESKTKLDIAIDSFFADMKRHGYCCTQYDKNRKFMERIYLSKGKHLRHGLYIRYKLYRHNLRPIVLRGHDGGIVVELRSE